MRGHRGAAAAAGRARAAVITVAVVVTLGVGAGAGAGAAVAAPTASAAPTAPAAPRSETAVVASVYDGDTLTLRDGRKVRLLQIDTPELGSGECYSRAAATALRALARPGSAVRLDPDPALDTVDRYGRLLRYIVRDGLNVNLELVRRGAAAPYFYRGERGRYSAQLLTAAKAAQAARRGLWGACPGARLAPERAVDTGTGGPPASASGAAASGTSRVAPTPVTAPAPGAARGAPGRCDPSYPDVCIPPAPPDLDCADVQERNFRVLPPDPHNFDGRDHDGRGCEG